MKSVTRRSSTLAVIGAVAVALAMPTAATASSPKQVIGPTVRYTNMDDFSSDARYAPFYTQQVAWGSLPCPTSPFGVDIPAQECALIVVPKDWKNPEAGTLKVAVGRNKLPADQPRTKRVLMSNNGGPGATGLGYSSTMITALGLQHTHDALDVDPRGVGLSTPNHCPQLTEQPQVEHPKDSREWLIDMGNAGNSALRACDQAPDSVIASMDSVNTARDFNLARHLAGYRTSDFFGTSYGSWLGSIMQRMFPLTFERVALDSSLDLSNATLAQGFEPQRESFQWALDRSFAPWLARHHHRFGLGSTSARVLETLTELQRRANAGEIATVSGDAFFMYLQGALGAGAYGYEDIADVLSALNKPPSGKSLPRLSSRIPQMPLEQIGAMLAVRCNDSGPAASIADQVDASLARKRVHPFLHPMSELHYCQGWARPNAVTPDILARPFKALLTQNENDGPTASFAAVKGALTAAGGSRMALVDDGHGHGAWAHSCTRPLITRLFAQGDMPAKHVHCQAGPLPLDDVVYEFGAAASDDNPLPVPNRYLSRDVDTPLPVDTTAPTAPTGTPATPATSRGLMPRGLLLTPWFSAALRAG